MEYFSALERNEILTRYNMDEPWRHYAKWKKPDIKGQILCDVLLCESWENRKVVAKDWGEGETVELLFGEYSVSVWEDENVLEMDGGKGCLTMWMCSMSLNWYT